MVSTPVYIFAKKNGLKYNNLPRLEGSCMNVNKDSNGSIELGDQGLGPISFDLQR